MILIARRGSGALAKQPHPAADRRGRQWGVYEVRILPAQWTAAPQRRTRFDREALASGDAQLVAGSSLMVYSGFRFVRLAHEAGLPIAIVNRGRARSNNLTELKIEGEVGSMLAAPVADSA